MPNENIVRPTQEGLRLIIHADDFGLSDSINNGIAQAHKYGILTSASVMPTAAATQAALELVRNLPNLDIGIHLTLVDELPALDPAAVPSLVTSCGRFHKHARVFAARYLVGRVNLDEVRQELGAQIELILDSGTTVSHLDSHQHVHMLPGIFRVVADLAKKYRIPAIRLPREPVRRYMFENLYLAGRVSELLVLNLLCRYANPAGLMTSDSFAGFVHGGQLDARNMLTVLANLPTSGTCELMCHPAADDNDSSHQKWNYGGKGELQALTSAVTRDYIREAGIQLISYKDLE